MSGGVIPSEAFNEQLKRTVRETMRREHSTQRPRGTMAQKGLDFSIDAVDNINGSKGRCSWGAEIGTTDFMWILDSIIVQPSCA
jgi:hypothetical protein